MGMWLSLTLNAERCGQVAIISHRLFASCDNLHIEFGVLHNLFFFQIPGNPSVIVASIISVRQIIHG